MTGRIFRIAGVSGSGKSTIAALIKKTLPETSNQFQEIPTKDLMCTLAGVQNEKDYRLLPEAERRKIFPPLMKKIAEIAKENENYTWFFERHLCSMNEMQSLVSRGIPEEHGPCTVGVAIIIAPEQRIAEWRISDAKTRLDRHLLPAETIATEQLQEINLALEAAKKWNFPIKLFFNEIGKDILVARQIITFMLHLQ